MLPCSSEVIISGSFALESGNELRTVEESFSLPMTFFCQILPPEQAKEAHKLTLSTNQTSSQIKDFFTDVIDE